MSTETIKTASDYTKLGIGFTLAIGAILILVSFFPGVPGNALLVLGLISVFMAIAAYVTTTAKLNSGDIAGAKGPCLGWGILLIFFGAVIGGLFFIFAHSKIADYVAPRGTYQYQAPSVLEPETVVIEGAPQATLYCDGGPDVGKSFTLTGRHSYTVGRSRSSNIRLSDQTVSRNHAIISWDGVDFHIEDLGSTNGTRLDGQPIMPGDRRRLEDGSEITLGSNTRLRFHRIGGIRPSEETPTQPS